MSASLRLPTFVVLVGILLDGTAMPVEAQGDPARAAEAARVRGEHERARRLAREALEQGTSEPVDAAALHRVIGLASAALGDDESARDAFTRLLGIRPEARLEADLPAELRSPYLEARGFWTGTTERLGIELELDESTSSVRARAVDPAGMASRYRVRARIAGTVWREVTRPPSDPIVLEIPGLADVRTVELSVAILDELGNRIYRRGSDDAPERMSLPARAAAASVAAAGPSGEVSRPDATPFHVTGTLLGLAGAGAIAGGAVSTAEALRLQDRWNSDDCLGGPPQLATRAETCPGVDDAARTNQTVSFVLYGVGGAALVAGIVLLAIAPGAAASDATEPSERPTASFACGSGPGDLGISCGVSM